MQISSAEIILTISAAIISGLGTALITGLRERKRERVRKEEKAQDNLKLELKDLQIKLYKLERDLDEWKDKYYEAIQELIAVKAELEDTLIKLSHVQIHINED
jgi:peptidoglycan hydrolase CwlO-like protein